MVSCGGVPRHQEITKADLRVTPPHSPKAAASWPASRYSSLHNAQATSCPQSGADQINDYRSSAKLVCGALCETWAHQTCLDTVAEKQQHGLHCRQTRKLRRRRHVHPHAWQGIQEEAPASATSSGKDSGVYAGLPFKQWLSPNGQWRVRPMRYQNAVVLLLPMAVWPTSLVHCMSTSCLHRLQVASPSLWHVPRRRGIVASKWC